MKGHSILFTAVCWMFFVFTAPATVFYVDVNSTNPVPPYAGWSTASTDIQSAIDAASDGDQIWVNDGIYQTGGRVFLGAITNRVIINKAVTVQSVNGPAVTMIQGNQPIGSNAVRCVFMATNSVLSGFTLTNGGTMSSGDPSLDQSGGGIWATNSSNSSGGVVSNCVLIGNAAKNVGGGAYGGIIYNSSIIQNSAYTGGGVGFANGYTPTVTKCLIFSNTATAYGGGAALVILNNCILSQNKASSGGGAEFSMLYGCLVVSNSASQMGGGIYDGISTINCTIVGNTALQQAGGVASGGTVYNCIIYFNTVTNGSSPNYSGSPAPYYCCTIPPSLSGGVIVTNDPLFVDTADGNFRFQSNSPCINSGNNAYVVGTNDLDGNPRIVGGTVDIGCYEYQMPASIISYAWLQQYGLPTDGTVDYADLDGNGMNIYQDWIAGLNPTNAASVLALYSPATTNTIGITVTWQSVKTRTYYLQSSTNLPAFISIKRNIVGQAGTTSYTDTTATNGGPYFYRVGVQ
jgi:hypothetical protein